MIKVLLSGWAVAAGAAAWPHAQRAKAITMASSMANVFFMIVPPKGLTSLNYYGSMIPH
jgi:hypothetical protein